MIADRGLRKEKAKAHASLTQSCPPMIFANAHFNLGFALCDWFRRWRKQRLHA